MVGKLFRILPNALRKRLLIKMLSQPLPAEIEEARKMDASLPKIFPKISFPGTIADITADNPIRKTPLRVYTPQGTGPFPVVVYFHGGGFCLGGPDLSDNVCRLLAKTAQCVVVSVDYALAPEHKYPFALNESYQTVLWVRKNAETLRIDPDKLVLAGDSAGGNIATALCLMAREKKEFFPLFQVLICPPLDLHTDPAEKMEGMQEILLTVEMSRRFNQYYLNDFAESKEPLASPIYAEDLSGMPPALVITAGLDPLAKEGERYAKLLEQAGVSVLHKHYEGLVHDFPIFAGVLKESEDAVKLIALKLIEVFNSNAPASQTNVSSN